MLHHLTLTPRKPMALRVDWVGQCVLLLLVSLVLFTFGGKTAHHRPLVEEEEAGEVYLRLVVGAGQDALILIHSAYI